jgi:hypothetical protein
LIDREQIEKGEAWWARIKQLGACFEGGPQINTIIAAPARRSADLSDDELALIAFGPSGQEEQLLLVRPELADDAAGDEDVTRNVTRDAPVT